jgi:photosystem II cytochrome c550
MMRSPGLTHVVPFPQISISSKIGWAIAATFIWVGMLVLIGFQPSAVAAPIDPYVLRYLDAAEPVELLVDPQSGATHSFSALDLSQGKRFFEENCVNCHVGGATLPNPNEPLSLDALRGAMPPRDTLNSLVAFIRQPMTYDGQESYSCRAVPKTWLTDAEAENVAAFILRAGQKAPGWGSREF